MTLTKKITRIWPEACDEATEWAAQYDDEEAREAWRDCERGDWMLGIAARACVDRRKIVRACVDVAALVAVIATPSRSWLGQGAALLHDRREGAVMTTEFKVGDRVRLTGEAWKHEKMHGDVWEVKGHHADGDARIRDSDGFDWYIYTGDGVDFSATLVEPAPPPPDTRKRLREYTDLADGDVVVIAGVPMCVRGKYLEAPGAPNAIQRGLHPWFRDMLVDEVRRKPRTKKRFIVEECEEHTGVMVHGIQVKVVEETEVPR